MDLERFGKHIEWLENIEFKLELLHAYELRVYKLKQTTAILIYRRAEDKSRELISSSRYLTCPSNYEAIAKTFMALPKDSRRNTKQFVGDYCKDLGFLLSKGVVEIRDLWI